MAIPDTGNPGSIYSQAKELAANGSPITDKIDKAAGTVKKAVTGFGDVMEILKNNWQLVLLGVIAVVLLIKRL